ncbi:MAG: DUF433 domain-containing protein [Parcubacteria group bacterium]|nr:DUF433 domain-containing protein [Parcubacteria group bacterium]
MNNEYEKRIVLDSHIMAGKPIIKGTRIIVKLVLRLLGEGETVEEILRDYPQVTREDIFAALKYATHIVEEEKVFSLVNSKF